MKDSSHYHFTTHWRVQAAPEEVYRILENAADLPRWWPSVYLDVQETKPEEADQPSVYHLYTKGWLPYTLRWQFQTVEKVPYKKMTLRATGDFNGVGIWTFQEDGQWVDITYDWKIQTNKPLLRRLSFLLKPVFSANHRWAMASGEKSLKLELARRHAATPEERAHIAPPPGPSDTSLLVLGAAAVSLSLLLTFLFFRSGR